MTFSEYVAKPFYMSCNYPTPPESYKSILAILSLYGFTNFSEPFAGTTTNVNNIVNALYGSMFAYIGWNFLNLVTQDMQKPSRDSPKAIFIATISVIVIYLLVIISYHTVLNIPEIVSSSAIAINFANKINKYYSYIIPIFVSLSTFGGLNGNFFTSVRLFVEGAHCGYLPKVLAMKHYSERTPIISNIVISIISIFMILSGSIDKLISMFCLLFWLSVEMSVVALLKYRWIHRNEQTNLLRIPIIFHFIFFICAIFMIAIPLYSFDMVSVIVIGVIVLGFLFYVIFIKYKKFHCDKLMVSITLLLQKLLMVTYIDDEEKVGTFELHLKK
ncbi:hypothetical protein A3Q56_04355 [Intoshia linei]|uniref:Uncharacterized protein n=1 Tax=Intoshia linei TaxID=1819745 RepID=A0A177B2F5_9BILA|nr:hypothetical protein A3Q56_04355 [Intoshia linei]